MKLKYTNPKYPELEFEPKPVHYQSLDLAIYLLKNFAEDEMNEKSKQILTEWVYHLENDGLKALNYIVFTFFQKNGEVFEQKEGVCFITSVMSWFVASIKYLEFLEEKKKEYENNNTH